MKYIRRSVKYFIQVSFIFIVIIGALMVSGMVSQDVNLAFRSGWKSIAYILGLFALMSAAYPSFGYGKRRIHAQGDPEEYWKGISEALEGRGYRQEAVLDSGARVYRLKARFNQAARLWEDAITITPVLGGFEAEGLTRDLARVVMSIDHKINNYGN